MVCPTKHVRDADLDPSANITDNEVNVKSVVVAQYVSMIDKEVNVKSAVVAQYVSMIE